MQKRVLVVFFLSLIVLASISVSASQAPSVYSQQSIVPEKEDLSLKGDLQVGLFQGSAVYYYDFDVPPGTNGLQPQIALSYNSHSGNQRSDFLGAGWSITNNYIQRKVNYTLTNTSDDEFKLSLNGAMYDLVYSASDEKFHTQIESFLDIVNRSGADNENSEYWVVRDKDGTNYRFGFNNESEMVSNQADHTWRWSLDLINDTYNNSVFYNYTESPHTEDVGVVYPDSIEYNNKGRELKQFCF